jgi:hypothetical protein
MVQPIRMVMPELRRDDVAWIFSGENCRRTCTQVVKQLLPLCQADRSNCFSKLNSKVANCIADTGDDEVHTFIPAAMSSASK